MPWFTITAYDRAGHSVRMDIEAESEAAASAAAKQRQLHPVSVRRRWAPRTRQIIAACVLAAVLAVGGTGAFVYRQRQQRSQFLRAASDIFANLRGATDSAAHLNAGVIDAWQSAIHSRNEDFNVAILQYLIDHKNEIELLKTGVKQAEKSLRELDVPDDMKEPHHARLLTAYGEVSTWAENAVSPSGSLMSYSQDSKRLSSSTAKALSEAEVLVQAR